MDRVFFSPMRYASARGLAMKAPFNDNIPPQTGDVMVNPIDPVNPDSNFTPPPPNYPYIIHLFPYIYKYIFIVLLFY